MKRKITCIVFVLFTFIIGINSCRNADEIQKARYFVNGKNVYEKNCQNCHGANAEGLAKLYPSLQNSDYIQSYPSRLACDIRFGLNEMPANPQLTAVEITYLINYIGNHFENSIGYYSQDQTLSDLENCK